MEFIIKNLQILKSRTDFQGQAAQLAKFIQSNPVAVEPNAKIIRRIFNYNELKLKSGLGSIYVINGTFFLSTGIPIGFVTSINPYIHSHLGQVQNISSREYIVLNRYYFDNKLGKLFDKYYPEINWLNDTLFNNLCLTKFKKEIPEDFKKSVIEEYLTERFSEIQNLEVLNGEFNIQLNTPEEAEGIAQYGTRSIPAPELTEAMPVPDVVNNQHDFLFGEYEEEDDYEDDNHEENGDDYDYEEEEEETRPF